VLGKHYGGRVLLLLIPECSKSTVTVDDESVVTQNKWLVLTSVPQILVKIALINHPE